MEREREMLKSGMIGEFRDRRGKVVETKLLIKQVVGTKLDVS